MIRERGRVYEGETREERREERGREWAVGRGRGEREHARRRDASTVVSGLQTLSSFLHINGAEGGEESKRDGMVRR